MLQQKREGMIMMWIYLSIIGIILILLIGWIIKTYNNLVVLKERVFNGKGQIAAQVESRSDAITNLIQATKSYSKHEAETLENVVSARIGVSQDAPIKEIEDYNNQLDGVIGRLLAISESYPELKASEVYQSTMGNVDKYEDQVRHSRMIYNDVVTRYNRLVKMFPSNIVANLFSFKVKEYFETSEGKGDMPSWE